MQRLSGLVAPRKCCTLEEYTMILILTFAKGAKFLDPSRFFNSNLEGTREGRSTSTNGAGAIKARKAAVAQNGPSAHLRYVDLRHRSPFKLFDC